MEASSSRSIEEVYAALSITEEEEGRVIVGADAVVPVAEDNQYAVVGRLLTDKPIKFHILRDTLASVWRPGRGVTIRELQYNLFLFQFYHELDITRIMEDGPWSFEQSLLVMRRLTSEESPLGVELFQTEMWIQVHDLPVGFMSKKVAKVIAAYVGSFIKMDQRNFEGPWRSFMRVRVAIDVRKPLKRRMKLKREGGEWF